MPGFSSVSEHCGSAVAALVASPEGDGKFKLPNGIIVSNIRAGREVEGIPNI